MAAGNGGHFFHPAAGNAGRISDVELPSANEESRRGRPWRLFHAPQRAPV
jgi:hypothetical protein